MIRVRFELVFSWQDFWVGLHVNWKEQEVYILPVPCLGVCVFWGK